MASKHLLSVDGIIWLIQHLTDVYLPWDHLVNTTLNRCLPCHGIIWLIQHLDRGLLTMGSFG